MNKKLVSSGLVAGLIAGGAAGLILQQTGFAGAASSSATTVVVDDDPATPEDESVATTTGRPDRGERLTTVLQPLVDDGTITAAQLTKIVDTLESAMPVGGAGHGGPGHGGPGHHGRGFGKRLEAAATALGMTVEELRTAVEGGSTLAEVATAEGVEVQAVIDALVAEVEARLAERVAAGDITQAEADAKLAEITTSITEMVNNGITEMVNTGRPERDA